MQRSIKGLKCVTIVALLLFPSARHFAGETIYQYSTIDSLLLGNYDGDLSMSQLLEQGDIGIGTFNALDGEMVLIDGKVFRVDVTGQAYEVPATSLTPFAAVAVFNADSSLALDKASSLEELNEKISRVLKSENIFYVIRIDGQFETMHTRSVPAQKKPYPPLVEVVKEQGLFNFEKVKGSLIGIKSPNFVKGIGVAGFHWHFITEDRQAGGHVLDCSLQGLTAQIATYSKFKLQLPETEDFLNADLNANKEKELERVEKSASYGE